MLKEFKNFSILEVANRLGLQFINKGPGNEQIYRCPFCGDSTKRPNKGHLYLNTENNLYRCHRCGVDGNSITLWANARNIDTKLAYKELCAAVEPEKIIYPSHPQKTNQEEQTSLKKRNSIYYSFLQELSLHPRHKQVLLERGLNEGTIVKNGYKSAPDTAHERWQVCKTLLKKGLSLENIPGFFTRNKYWDFYAPPGYFIPVRAVSGEIQGLQIRAETYFVRICTKPKASYGASEDTKKAVAWVEALLENEKVFISGTDGNYKKVLYDLGSETTIIARKKVINGCTVLQLYDINDDKYRWFSSKGMPNGTSAKAYTHFAANYKNDKIWITEGPLKADVASSLLGAPFIGTPSVSSWETIQPVLNNFKPKLPFLKKDIVIAFDSDIKTKPYLLDSLQNFLEELRNNGFKPVNAAWSPSAGNGIDDVLLKLAKNEIKEIIFTLDGVPVTVRHETKTTVRVG